MTPPSTLPVVWHEAYEVDIGPHVFPTRKYRLVRDRLLAEGTISAADLVRPEPVDDQALALVHTADYLRKIDTGSLTLEERLVLEVSFSPALREASRLCAGGSLLTARYALERGVAVHLGGGFHHAFPDHGEGFCLINDVAVALRVLRRDGVIARAAVVDLDVHHGNGTAAIFAAEPEVFTFSMHQERNYPAVKPASDLDVALDDGTSDDEYLRFLEESLHRILHEHRPDLVLYLAGADPYREDQLGGLGLSVEGLKRRDEIVLQRAGASGVAVAVALAGGYARIVDDTIEIHCNTVRVARRAIERTRV